MYSDISPKGTKHCSSTCVYRTSCVCQVTRC